MLTTPEIRGDGVSGRVVARQKPSRWDAVLADRESGNEVPMYNSVGKAWFCRSDDKGDGDGDGDALLLMREGRATDDMAGWSDRARALVNGGFPKRGSPRVARAGPRQALAVR